MKKEKVINILLNLIILGLIVVLFLIIFWTPIEKEEKIKNTDKEGYIINFSEDIFDTLKVDEFEFTTSSVVPDGAGGYRVEVNVENISDKVKYLSGFTLIIKDVNGKKIDSLSSFEYMEFSPGDSMLFMLECDKDLLQENYKIEYRPSYVIGG